MNTVLNVKDLCKTYITNKRQNNAKGNKINMISTFKQPFNIVTQILRANIIYKLIKILIKSKKFYLREFFFLRK